MGAPAARRVHRRGSIPLRGGRNYINLVIRDCGWPMGRPRMRTGMFATGGRPLIN